MAGGPRILVVGCGIGGMALALALRRRGLDATVLEQAPAIEAVGAGIQLSPNATRILGRLGLAETLAGFSVRPEGLQVRAWDSGEEILWTPLGDRAERRFGAPYYHAHRADLLDALIGAVGLETVRLNARVAEVAQDGGGVRAVLQGGEAVDGDVLVGADGIHSVVRERLFSPEAPRFSGCMAWRGVIPAEAIAGHGLEPRTYAWWGPGRSMVNYYVSGGRQMNWIGIGPGDGSAIESWSAKGTVEDALAEFEGWHPAVTAMIRATEHPFKWALHDREPLPAWVDGRVALLGDAAHSMLPYHAQGAATSIEDAYVLAACLADAPGDPPAALARYQGLRLRRANGVQRFSRAAEQLFHMADPDRVARRNRRLRENQAQYPGGFPDGQVWLYGYDPENDLRAVG